MLQKLVYIIEKFSFLLNYPSPWAGSRPRSESGECYVYRLNADHFLMDRKQLQALQQDLEGVQARLEKLGRGLEEEGRKVQEQGFLPDRWLLEEADRVAEEFHRLAQKLQVLSANLLPDYSRNGPLSVADLQELQSRLAEQLARLSAAAAPPDDKPEESPQAEPTEPWAQQPEAGETAPAGQQPLDRQQLQETREEPGPKPETPDPRQVEEIHTTRDLETSDLERFTYRLLKEGRLEPAFWLSSYVQQKTGSSAVPPLLIKAVELAASVQGEGSPAARWLEHLYRQLDYASLYRQASTREQAKGLALLITISLLRPALVAPASGALELLRWLTREESFLAHCPFLEPFWEKKSPERNTHLERSLESLAAEVETWERRNQSLSLASPTADSLWKSLQEEEGLLQNLIGPVRENDGQAVAEVERLVNCLRRGDNMKKELAMLYRKEHKVKEQDIFHIPGSWQVLVRLEEAIRLAERWLKLRRKISAGQEYEKLMQGDALTEALGLARDALRKAAARENQPPLVEAAVALTHQALANLEQEHLQVGVPSREPLTAAEMADRELKLHFFLRLEPGWVPDEKTVERMSRALLELLQEKARVREPVPVPEGYRISDEQDEPPVPPHGDSRAHRQEDSRLEARETPPPGTENGGAGFSHQDPLEGLSLTPQEKNFIKDVLKDLGTDTPDSND